MMLIPRCITIAFFFAAPLFAEPTITSHEFAAEFADFAFQPGTGTVAAVDPKNKSIAFFSQNWIAGKNKKAITETTELAAIAIRHKRFKDKEWFAIGEPLTKAIVLYDPTTHRKVTRIPIQFGCRQFASSTNPDDPFLYYFYGTGHDAKAGAIDLRTMKDVGEAFDDAAYGAISADGTFAYRRGPWGPSGFESLLMNNATEFKESPPTFSRYFYAHTSNGAYIPGPRSQMTAAGPSIYTCDLTQKLATFKDSISCFFTNTPIAICLRPQDRDKKVDKPWALSAISYNTFSAVGSEVALPGAWPPTDSKSNNSNRSQFTYQRRFFADDARNQVIIAQRNSITAIPLSLFKLPSEPVLNVELETPGPLLIEEKHVIKMKKSYRGMKVVAQQLPEGMIQNGDELHWQPNSEQTGPYKIQLALSHGELKRTQAVNLNVIRPSLSLPFAPTNYAVNDEAKTAIFWGGARNNDVGAQETDLTLVDLTKLSILATTTIQGRIIQALLTKDHVIIHLQNRRYVEILNPNDLTRKKLLYSSSELQAIDLLPGNRFSMRDGSGTTIYLVEDLQPIGPPVYKRSRRSANQVSEDLRDGILFVEQGKQAHLMVVPPTGLISGHVRQPKNLIWRRSGRWKSMVLSNNHYSSNRRHSQTGFLLDSSPVSVQAKAATVDLNVPGSVHTSHRFETIDLDLIDLTTNQVRHRVPLVKHRSINRNSSSSGAVKLFGIKDQVWILQGRSLYNWHANQSTVDLRTFNDPLRLPLRQSAFLIPADDTDGLRHEATGGNGPYNYSLMDPMPWISINAKSGVVSIDKDLLLEASIAQIRHAVNQAAKNTDGTNTEDVAIAKAAAEHADIFEKHFGIRTAGLPVTTPIVVIAKDIDLQSSMLQYHVALDYSLESISEALQESLNAKTDEIEATRMPRPAITPQANVQTAEEQQKRLEQIREQFRKRLAERQQAQKATSKAIPTAVPPPTKIASEPEPKPAPLKVTTSANHASIKKLEQSAARLENEVSTLNARLDLLTRQLSTVIKKLEEQKTTAPEGK